MLAGVSGLEPEPKVLETSMLTIDTIPLRLFSILDFGLKAENLPYSIANRKSQILTIYFLYVLGGSGNVCKIF
jgi:hypothetical protein